jgi:DNA-binding XRE family transcriptional regulator
MLTIFIIFIFCPPSNNSCKNKLLRVIANVIIITEGTNMDFASQVKQVRNELGISQEDLARELHVSFATVNRWENNKTKPSKMALSIFRNFCQTKGIDVEN